MSLGEGREDFGHLANKQNHDFGIFDFRILGFWILGLWILGLCDLLALGLSQCSWEAPGGFLGARFEVEYTTREHSFYPTRNQHRRPTLSPIESTPPRSLM